MMEWMDSVKIPEVSTADPLKQNKKSSSHDFLWKSTYYSFCPEIYKPIILE